ncbi:MAG: RodZ domain-containing protein, partial [Nitrospirota bacterium]
METIGEYLKRIREERGLPIQQVADKTRISPTYIEALEENRLEKFPGEVFARGFVRVYGRCLGLDDPDTMARFTQSAQPFFRERDEKKRFSAQSAEHEKIRRERRGRIMQVAIVAVLGLTILTVYVINSRHSQGTEEAAGPIPNPPSAPASGTVISVEPYPELMEPAVNKPALKEAGPAKPAHTPPSPVEGLTLVIEAVESSWVSAKIDGGETKEVFLEPGKEVTWKASDHFLVNFGNAGGVKVRFNGKSLPPFGPKGAVV